MHTKIIERYFFFGLLLATFIFTILIFKPFWVVLILSIAFSVVFYPLFTWINSKNIPKWLSSLLVVILFTLILWGPLFGVGALVFNQAQDLYVSVIEGQGIPGLINSLEDSVNNFLPTDFRFDADEKLYDLALFVSNNITKIFSTTLSTFFSFTLILLSMFYFLKDGKRWKEELVRLSPLKDEDDHKILERLSRAIKGVVTGYLLIALVQGTLMGVGLWIFGVPSPALWGLIAGIGSLIPMIGTSIISIPTIIYLIIQGNFIYLIGFSIWAFLMVGTIDNILNPYLVGDKIEMPPLLVLFAVLGGLSLLGPVGILIGPLTISLLYTLISIYKNEFEEKEA